MVDVRIRDGGLDCDALFDEVSQNGVFSVRVGDCLFVSPDEGEILECMEVVREHQRPD